MALSPVSSQFLILGLSTVLTVGALGAASASTSRPAQQKAPQAEQRLGELPPDDVRGPTSTSVTPSVASPQIVRAQITPVSQRPRSSTAAAPWRPASSSIPGATTTGVPAGTKLRVHTGRLIVRTPGKVIDGLEVRGKISVEAPNVTIRNTRVIVPTGAQTFGISNNNAKGRGMVVRNVEVRAAKAAPGVNGIVGHHFTVERSNIHHVTDQVHITGSNVIVRNNWFHDNYHFAKDPYHKGGASHDDSIQIIGGSNITINNNRFYGAYNAGVQITQGLGIVSRVTIRNNVLGGGGCTVNIAESGRGPIAGTVIRDNRFLRGQRLAGCAIIRPTSTTVTSSGNVWDATGKPVGLTRG